MIKLLSVATLAALAALAQAQNTAPTPPEAPQRLDFTRVTAFKAALSASASDSQSDKTRKQHCTDLYNILKAHTHATGSACKAFKILVKHCKEFAKNDDLPGLRKAHSACKRAGHGDEELDAMLNTNEEMSAAERTELEASLADSSGEWSTYKRCYYCRHHYGHSRMYCYHHWHVFCSASEDTEGAEEGEQEALAASLADSSGEWSSYKRCYYCRYRFGHSRMYCFHHWHVYCHNEDDEQNENTMALQGSVSGEESSSLTPFLAGGIAGAGIATLGTVMWATYKRRKTVDEDASQLKAMRITQSERV